MGRCTDVRQTEERGSEKTKVTSQRKEKKKWQNERQCCNHRVWSGVRSRQKDK